MNNIAEIRGDIKTYFDPSKLIEGSAETSVSPSGNYRLDTSSYNQTKPNCNWSVTKIEIFDNKSNEIAFSFFCNDDQFFYSWLTHGPMEYFICAEDIFGGQTIIDLTRKKMESYSPNEDGFIWTDFHLSPDGKHLATIGCYWACSFVIKLFDFTNPLSLPLTEIKEIELLDNDEIISGWTDNETIKTKGIKRERETEYCSDGSQRKKTISEKNVERLISINGGLHVV
ncbi:MAG: hypothetical protein ABJB11_11040 [Ferruginibacter sp.]